MSNHERLKHLKENLMCAIETQMCNLYEADCDELGEAIDMLKDLEEAMYFCAITEAMRGGGNKEKEYELEMKGNKHHNEERMYYPNYDTPIMYSDGNTMTGTNHNGSSMSSKDYSEPRRDSMEGRSHMNRRMYMEAKHTQADKATQLRELEKYMQELTNDIVDMISDTSPEEKQYLEKKMTTLAAKIGQMK